MSENRCVCCGEVIPEGTQTCKTCVRKYMEQERQVIFSAVATLKNGKQKYNSGTLQEMTEWADEMMKASNAVEINIRRAIT